MKTKKLQLLLLILTITSLMLLVGIQISWVLKSAKVQEAQFSHTVTLAMNRIVENLSNNEAICQEMNNCIHAGKSGSCLLLMRNRIEWTDLDSLIKNDLVYYNINLDYEFDIVKKGTDALLTSGGETYINDNLQKILNESGYELRIRFPEKREFIRNQTGYIFISSIALLVLVCVSFLLIYKFYKREKKLTGNIIDFINNMTHEFKTPLTNIALANSMISKNEMFEKDEKLSSYSKVIKTEHQRLKDKVDILLKAAITENDKHLNFEPFDAEAEIRNIAGTFSVILEEKNGSIQIITSGCHSRLSGNVEMFQIAIGNIIDNAIKYNTNKPDVAINIESGKKSLLIKIRDNGIGISKENLPYIFDKFSRISEGDIHNNDGFGLGLYFVKKTVEQMQGKITAASTVGKGTIFTLEFPLLKV